MKLIQYGLELDRPDRVPVLVSEGCRYCRGADKMNTPQKVADILNGLFHASDKAEEHVWLAALRSDKSPIGIFGLSHGAVNVSIINPREVFVRLCLCGASEFILAHNHPSGSAVPSASDVEATARMKEASRIMGIGFTDHIIIGEGCCYSFAEHETL